MKLAVLLNGSNHIVSIVEGSNTVFAARQADAMRGISRVRNFKEVVKDHAGADYNLYVLDNDDVKLLTSHPDSFEDPKYFNYVRVNCPHKAALAAA